MKKISLLICTVLLALTFFGCKQNADEMSKYSKAPNVTLPPSRGEDILAGKSFNEPLYDPYARWEFNDDGTFTEYDTHDKHDRIRAVYRYTYDAEKRVLSYVMIETSVYGGICGTYSIIYERIKNALKNSASLREYLISAGSSEDEADNDVEMMERIAGENGFESLDEYLHAYFNLCEFQLYAKFDKKTSHSIEIDNGRINSTYYVPDVSFKELYDTYGAADLYFSSVTDDKISYYLVNEENCSLTCCSVPYTYDINTKILKYERDGETIGIDLITGRRIYE